MALRLPSPADIISNQEIADFYTTSAGQEYIQERFPQMLPHETIVICPLCLCWTLPYGNPAGLTDGFDYHCCKACSFRYVLPAKKEGITREGRKYMKGGKEVEVSAPENWKKTPK